MRWLILLAVFVWALLCNRMTLALELVAVRQQLSNYTLKKKQPRLNKLDRLFWLLLSSFWNGWKSVLAVVKPETVIGWHRKGFKLFWRMKSDKPVRAGRPSISREARTLIAKMTHENPTWGAPRIVKELKILGYDISESSVHRYRDRSGKPPSQTWKTFLKNHAKDTVSIDFLVMPTITFAMLHVFVILDNSRRKILHFNVTSSPTAEWTINQIKEAFPWDTAPKYLLRDNDPVYSNEFKTSIKNMGIEDKPTTPYSPWQNPYVERANGSIRRDCLDHVIVLNEKHLYKIMTEYVEYYNNVRCHESLDGNSPIPRKKETGKGKILSEEYLGGLHHRYYRKAS